jgi:hypothetical protein
MGNGRGEVQWSPRVPKWKLQRLYQSDAQGLLDADLLEDVGITLLRRCTDILTIKEAKHGRVLCPRCDQGGHGQRTVIQRALKRGDPRDEVLGCPTCGWRATWGEYALSFKRNQLNSGGATEAFEAYIRDYRAATTPGAKFLIIDRLIHEFHYSYADQPDLPSRPVGVNLIQGKLTDVIVFLDALNYGDRIPTEVQARRAAWREQVKETLFHELVSSGITAE